VKKLVKLLSVGFVFILSLVLISSPVLADELLESGEHKYKRVTVNAVWIPIDPDTNQILPHLTPVATFPDAYPRSEVAEWKDDEFYITYMGTPEPAEPGSWSANNMMYTGNVFFSDRFLKIVAQGYSVNATSACPTADVVACPWIAEYACP
jgi:hypothetical protein